MKRGKNIFAVCGILLVSALFASSAHAKIDVPGRTRSWVNDYAGIIDKETKEYLENLISSMEQKTKDPVEIIIATFKSLEGWRVRDFALRYGEKWRLSKTGRDNGVVLLVALEEGRVNIGVGQNLKSILTDAKTRDIIDNVIIPEFSRGDYQQGIRKGAEVIVNLLSIAEIPEGAILDIFINIVKIAAITVLIIIFFIVGLYRRR